MACLLLRMITSLTCATKKYHLNKGRALMYYIPRADRGWIPKIELVK